MNENINEFIYDAFMACVFIVAISVFFIIYEVSSQNINSFENMYDREVLIVENADKEIRIVDKGMIVASLYSGLQCDIEVEGILFNKDLSPYNYTLIQEGEYSLNPIIDIGGKVIKVDYIRR